MFREYLYRFRSRLIANIDMPVTKPYTVSCPLE